MRSRKLTRRRFLATAAAASSIVAMPHVRGAHAAGKLSVVAPSGRPNGYPALWHFSAATRKLSQVQVSASALGAAPAGYMPWMSIPACSLSKSKRLQVESSSVPRIAGTTRHCRPSGFAR